MLGTQETQDKGHRLRTLSGLFDILIYLLVHNEFRRVFATWRRNCNERLKVFVTGYWTPNGPVSGSSNNQALSHRVS